MTWIVIPNWEKFQHYRERDPIWIKNYTRLISHDAYRGLTFPQRAVLHGLWMEYARSHRKLPGNTREISRRLGGRVTRRTLEALNHAGFIEFSASAPLARRYHAASPEEEVLRTSSKSTLARALTDELARVQKRIPPPPCDECGVGAGMHAADCSRAAR